MKVRAFQGGDFEEVRTGEAVTSSLSKSKGEPNLRFALLHDTTHFGS